MSRHRLGVFAAMAIAAIAGCSVTPEPGPIRSQMLTHFDLASDLRSFALFGDLDDFRRTAARLADLRPSADLGAARTPQLLPLTRAARDAERARTIDEAARATAEVARACADCHVANRVGLGDRLGAGSASSGGGVRGHMAESSRVSGLLWNGLAAPSDDIWNAGAEALEAAGRLPVELTRDLPAAYVSDAGETLQQLGRAAAQATLPVERADLLAEVWTTCADCHFRAGVR